VVLTSWNRRMSDCPCDPPATEAVKKLLDQNITQVTESLCHIRDRSNFSQLLPHGGTDLMGPRQVMWPSSKPLLRMVNDGK
jgi:hypothetical protein